MGKEALAKGDREKKLLTCNHLPGLLFEEIIVSLQSHIPTQVLPQAKLGYVVSLSDSDPPRSQTNDLFVTRCYKYSEI